MYSAIRKYLVVFVLLFCVFEARSAHIVGGDLSYTCLGGGQYEVTLHVYKNAFSGIFLETNALLYAIDRDNNTVIDTVMAPQVSLDTLPENNIGCVIGAPTVVTQNGYYTGIFDLPLNTNGYDIIYQRCCRTNGAANMHTFGAKTSTYILTITRDGMLACNDGPRFVKPPPILICNNSPLVFDQSATDNEGDQMVYSFCTPLDGQLTAACDFNIECPVLGLEVHPFPTLAFYAGYSTALPLGAAADPLRIDANSGLLEGTATSNGVFQIAICVEEYRNGVLMSSTTRDFQLNVASCQIVIGFTDPVYRSCSNTIDFNNQSINADAYEWDFGDGNTSTAFEPTHTYAAPGIYNVSLVASQGAICSDTAFSTALVIYDTPPQADFDVDSVCEGTAFTFDNQTSDPAGLVDSYEWTIEGNTYNAFEPTIPFNNSGLIDVQLVAINDSGCYDTSMMVMTVYDSIGVNVTSGDYYCLGDSVFFTNSSTGAIDSVFWDFGNGNTSDIFSPAHLYASPGQYTANLTLYNSGCGDKYFQKVINIVNQPVIDLGPDMNSCNGPPLTFTIDTTGIGNATITWSTGSNLPSITIPGGTTQVFVEVDNFGCVDRDTINLTGSDPIVLDVTIDAANCGLFPVNITNNSTGDIDSVLWDFGDGNTSAAFTPSYTYASGGSYTIDLTLYNAVCGDQTFQQNVSIVTTPVFDLGPPREICVGVPNIFTIDTTGFGPHTINWSTGDTTPSISITGGVPTLSVSVDNGCLATDLVLLTDSDSIVTDVNIPDNVCSSSPVNFTNNSTGDIDSVSWDFGDGNFSTIFSPTHMYGGGGVYTVTLTMYNASCGALTYQEDITIATQPVFDLGPPQGICVGVPSTFTIDTTGFGPHTINWSTGDTTPSVSITGGVPNLSVTVINGCTATDNISLTDADSIIVDVTIPANECASSAVSFTNNSTGDIDSLLWDFGDGNTSTVFSPSHTYAGGGLYTVSLTMYNASCGPANYTQNINLANQPVFDLGPPQDICIGNPSVFTIDTTGFGPHTIAWSTGDTTPDVSISGGVPTLSVSVDNGCLATDLVILTDKDSIIMDIDFPDNICSSAGVNFINNSTGDIDSVLWDFGDGNTSTDFAPTHNYGTSGSFTVTVTLYNSACGPKTYQKNIGIGSPPVVDLGPPQELCTGVPQLFQIDTTGFGDASILWSTGDTTPQTLVTGGATDVSVSVDYFGCTAFDLVGLTSSDSIVVDITVGSVFCNLDMISFVNNSTGTIDSIIWDFGDGNGSTDNSPVHSYTASGTYTVVADLYNSVCGNDQFSQAITIVGIPNADVGSDVIVCDNMPYTLTLDTIGNGPSAILWSTGETVPAIAVPLGMTEVSVIVDNGCTAYDTVSLSYPAPIVLDVNIPNISCAAEPVTFTNNSTGVIDSVSWDFGDGNSTNATSPVHTYATSGSYTVVFDIYSSACGDQQVSQNILISDAPNADLGDDIIVCNTIPYTITVDTTGNGPSTILWSTGDMTPSINVPPGLTELSVSINNGCTSYDTIAISYYDEITADAAIPAVSCINSVVSFANNSTGTIDSVLWDFGDGNSSNASDPTHTYASAGTYTITLDIYNTACGNAQYTDNIIISELPNADIGGDIAVCVGVPFSASVDTTGDGPSDILWSTGDTTPVITVPGGLTELSVIVDNGCISGDTVQVSYSDSIILDVEIDDTYCFTDPVNFINNSTGDIDAVFWQFGDGSTSTETSPVHTYLLGGQYSVTLDLANTACGNEQFTKDIFLNGPPNVDLGGDIEVCQGVPYTLTLDTTGFGPHTILWSTGDTMPSIIINGGLSAVTVDVDNGCTASDMINITYLQPIQPDISIPANACSGDSIAFGNTTTGDIQSIFWDFGDGNTSTELNPYNTYANPGQYSVVVDLFNSVCSDTTVQGSIFIRNTPVVDLGLPVELCTGVPQLFSIDTTGFGGASILWSTGDTTPQTMVIGGASDVSVSVDYFGCTAVDLVGLTSKDSIVLDVDIADQTCITNIATFTNNSIGDIESTAWDFGDGNTSTDFSPLHGYSAPGTYTVSVLMTNNACGPAAFSKDIQVSGLLNADITGPGQICTGDPAVFSIDTTSYNGASILWSTGESTPSVTISGGVINLSVTVDNGCTATDAVGITYVNGITPDISIPDNNCLDNPVFFINRSTGDIESVFWDFGDGNLSIEYSPEHTYSSAGVYQVEVEMTNSACGDVIINEPIRILATPEIDLGPRRDICEGFGETIILDTTGFYGATVEWSTGETGPEIFVSEGNVLITVTVDNYGCIVRDELIISNDCPIFIPTAFTPDGFNTTFNVINKNIESYELRIYNRWGEQIFATSDFFRGWDGTYKGVDAEMDVYVWILTGNKIGGKPFLESGNVMLVR